VPSSFSGEGPQNRIRDFVTPCFVPESLFVRVSIQGTFTASVNPLVSGWALQADYVNGGGTFGPMGSGITTTWTGGLHSLKLVGGTNGVTTNLGASAGPGSPSQNVTYFLGGFGRSQGGNQSILVSRNGFGGENTCPCPPPVGTSLQRVSHYVLFSNIVVVVSPEPNNLVVDQVSPAGEIIEGDSVRLRARSTVTSQIVSVRDWMFQADSGGPVQFICSSGSPNCDLRASVSGVAYVRARLGGSGWLLQANRRIDVTPARLRIVADKPHAGRGKDVTFTVSSAGGRPFSVQNWHPSAAGEIRNGCVPGSTTCKWRLADSLWMVVAGTVNGLQRRDSVRVLAVDCPKDDPVLDYPGMRELLRALLLRSDFDGLEHAGLVVRRPDGSYYVHAPPVSGNTCTSSPFPSPPPSPDSVMFIAHTHPYRIGQATCDNGVYRIGIGGVIASREDWSRTSEWKVPHVIIDKNLVARVNPVDSLRLNDKVYGWKNPEAGTSGSFTGPDSLTIAQNAKQVRREGNQCVYP
jgi:hypothetical protein